MYNKWAANSLMNTCVFQTGCVFVHTALQENHNGPFAWWYHLLLRPESFRISFLVQITAFVMEIWLGLPNLNMKRKTKRILVVKVKWRHHVNGLCIWVINFFPTMWWTVTGGAAGGGYSQVIPMEEVSSKIFS